MQREKLKKTISHDSSGKLIKQFQSQKNTFQAPNLLLFPKRYLVI